jgi:adenine phosphoribosyltransferase
VSSGDDLRTFVRDIADFPKPGILFRDLTPLMRDPAAFHLTIERLAEPIARLGAQVVVGIESRGFIFGAAVAERLRIGFVPIRKPGKLPGRTRQRRYELEYGSDAVEVHEDAVGHGTPVALVDDVLATGGTAAAAIHLLGDLGARVVTASFVLELAALHGRKRLGDVPVDVLVTL